MDSYSDFIPESDRYNFWTKKFERLYARNKKNKNKFN